MRRAFYTDACALSLSTMPTESRLAFWKELEREFALAWREAHPDAPAAEYEHDWLSLAQDVGRRLTALENRPRPILRLKRA